MRTATLLGASVTLLWLVQAAPALGDGVLPAVATPVQREQAQARFLRGKALMKQAKFAEALNEFQASHEIVASPNTRLETGRCLLAMGHLIAGYAELGRAAIEAKELTGQDHRYQRALDAATAERAEIEPKLGFVSLTIDKPSEETRVTVGGEEIRRAAWTEPAPVQAGAAEIVVSTPGHEPVKRTVTLAAGEKTSLTVDAQAGPVEGADAPAPQVEPPPRPVEKVSPHWTRTGAYVAGGVGVAGMVVFTVFGLMARATYEDLNGACAGGPCPAGKADEISSGKTDQTVANVGLVLGVAGAAAGITLWVVATKNESHAQTAAVTVSPAWIGIRGNL